MSSPDRTSTRSFPSAKKPTTLSPQQAYLLSTVFGKNSVYREQIRQYREKNPLPSDQDDEYARVPEMDQEFEIPKRGTSSHEILKALCPHLLKSARAKKRAQATEEAASKIKPSQKVGPGRPKSNATSTASTKASKLQKKTPKSGEGQQGVRKSSRIAKKRGVPSEVPLAPVKKTTVEPEEQPAQGYDVVLQSLKTLQKEVQDYINHLSSGKYLMGSLKEATRECLQQRLEEIQDFQARCEAKLEEASEVMDERSYGALCEEYRRTLGHQLYYWKRNVEEWFMKRTRINFDTPEQTIVTETPGLGKFSSSEETLSLAEVRRRRSKAFPKGPLELDSSDFDENSQVKTPRRTQTGSLAGSDQEEATPTPRYVATDTFIIDSAMKRTRKGNTPDPRVSSVEDWPEFKDASEQASLSSGATSSPNVTPQGEDERSGSPDQIIDTPRPPGKDPDENEAQGADLSNQEKSTSQTNTLVEENLDPSSEEETTAGIRYPEIKFVLLFDFDVKERLEIIDAIQRNGEKDNWSQERIQQAIEHFERTRSAPIEFRDDEIIRHFRCPKSGREKFTEPQVAPEENEPERGSGNRNRDTETEIGSGTGQSPEPTSTTSNPRSTTGATTRTTERSPSVQEVAQETDIPEGVTGEESGTTGTRPKTQGSSANARSRGEERTNPPATEEDPVFAANLRYGTLDAIHKAIEENRWQGEQEFRRICEAKAEKARKIREQQQELQLASVQLYDIGIQDSEDLQNIIGSGSKKRGWHWEDIAKLKNRFLETGMFPLELVDDFVRRFLKPLVRKEGGDENQELSQPASAQTEPVTVIRKAGVHVSDTSQIEKDTAPPQKVPSDPSRTKVSSLKQVFEKSVEDRSKEQVDEDLKERWARGPEERRRMTEEAKRVATPEELAELAINEQRTLQVQEYMALRDERNALANELAIPRSAEEIKVFRRATWVSVRLLDERSKLISPQKLRDQFNPAYVPGSLGTRMDRAEEGLDKVCWMDHFKEMKRLRDRSRTPKGTERESVPETGTERAQETTPTGDSENRRESEQVDHDSVDRFDEERRNVGEFRPSREERDKTLTREEVRSIEKDVVDQPDPRFLRPQSIISEKRSTNPENITTSVPDIEANIAKSTGAIPKSAPPSQPKPTVAQPVGRTSTRHPDSDLTVGKSLLDEYFADLSMTNPSLANYLRRSVARFEEDRTSTQPSRPRTRDPTPTGDDGARSDHSERSHRSQIFRDNIRRRFDEDQPRSGGHRSRRDFSREPPRDPPRPPRTESRDAPRPPPMEPPRPTQSSAREQPREAPRYAFNAQEVPRRDRSRESFRDFRRRAPEDLSRERRRDRDPRNVRNPGSSRDPNRDSDRERRRNPDRESRRDPPRDPPRDSTPDPPVGRGGPPGRPPGRRPSPPRGGPPGGGPPGGGPPGGRPPGGGPPGGGPPGGRRPPGGGSSDDSSYDSYDSSSSDSSSSDGEQAGFNASIYRTGNVDPFRHGQAQVHTRSFRPNTTFDPSVRYSKIPLKQPEKFTGSGRPRWEEFLNRYETFAGNKNAPEEEKFQLLLDCLGGEAKIIVGGFTEVPYEPGMYEDVLKILEQHYGDTRNVKSILMSKLNAFPTMKKMEYGNCARLAAILDDFEFRCQKVYGTNPVTLGRFYDTLDTQAELLLRIFPPYERQQFFKGLAKRNKDTTFRCVRDFFRVKFTVLAKQRQFERTFESDHQDKAAFTTEGTENSTQTYHAHRSRRHQEVYYEDDSRGYEPSGSESAYQAEDRKPVATEPRKQPMTVSSAPNTSGGARPTPPPCGYCDAPNHSAWKCPEFLTLTMVARYEAVRKKGMCYHCLNKGHGINKCTFYPDRQCGVDGCTSRHHRLVHRPRNLEKTMMLIEDYLEESQEREDDPEETYYEMAHFTSQLQTFLTEDLGDDATHADLLPLEQEYCAIRQVTCDLIYPGGRKRVVVALDSCANNTNIEGNFARRLNLPIQRSNIKREMSLVKGTHKFTSNYVNFQLAPVGQKGPLFNIGAYTIDDLIEGTPVPDWTKALENYPYLKEADPKPPEEDDKCLILLGTDLSGMMSTSKELKGGQDEPLAGLGPLGWWFQGRTGKLTKKGAIHFARHHNFFQRCRAKADWEPEWVTVKRLLGAGLKYDPGIEVPEISSHQAWAILASKGIGQPAQEIANGSSGMRSEHPPDLEAQDSDASSEQMFDIPNKGTFRAKPLSELRSSEPTQERTLASEEVVVVAEEVQRSEQEDEFIFDNFTINMFRIPRTQEHVAIASHKIEGDLLGHESNKILQEVRREFNSQEWSYPGPSSKRKNRSTKTKRKPMTVSWVTNDTCYSASKSLVMTNRNLLRKTRRDGMSHPEHDNLGMQVILNLQQSIKKSQSEDVIEDNLKLNDLLQKHWELEAVGLAERIPRTSANKGTPMEKWTPEQRAIDEKMKVVYIPEEQRYQMSIPWKDGDKPNFRCNREAVKARQEAQYRKLPPDQAEKVDKIFEGYLEKDYIRALEGIEIVDRDSRYLPYFTVCDELKETTPVRIVWDCRAVYYGKSLNTEIEETPNRLQDLVRVLLRLRKFEFALTADVSEMFLRVSLDPRDRRYHRFIHDTRDYEWKSMLFGNQASPNASQKVFATLCEQFGAEFPEAVETLKHSFYMDDASDSRPTEEATLALATQLVELLKKASMAIRKFYSNSTKVLRSLDQDLLAKQVVIGEDSISIEPGKILGMRYNAGEGQDFLSYTGRFKSIREWSNRSTITKVEPGKWTKRKIAQAAASIYDPHGLISPFTVRSKVVLQEIWRLKHLGWDDVIPEGLSNVWENWLEQVFVIQDLRIPRWTKFEPRCTFQLHCFCDASDQGMCVAVYLRVKKRSGIYTTLLAAKSRVSPLKAESISRLELVACTMGVRLVAAIKEVYPAKEEDIFFWTDSMVCLHWILTPAKAFMAYVSHRVGEIQSFTEPRQWRHVPGKFNPADIGTREISAKDLQESKLWWEGPEFLKLPPSEWPKRSIIRIEEIPEMKPTIFVDQEKSSHDRHVHFQEWVEVRSLTSENQLSEATRETLAVHEQKPRRAWRNKIRHRRRSKLLKDFRRKPLDLTLASGEVPKVPTKRKHPMTVSLDPDHYSVGLLWNGYRKLLRIMAYVIRFVRHCLKAIGFTTGNRTETKELQIPEISIARKRLIKMSQRKYFGEEIDHLIKHGNSSPVGLPQKSRIRKFNPMLDEQDILRSNSRLEKSEIYGYDQTFPIILDRRSGLARLIVENAHFELAHPIGHNAVKAKIHSEYIVTGLGTLLWSTKWKCKICQRQSNRPLTQLQAALPKRRLGETRLRAFTDVGLDYAGPFFIIQGRGQRRKKIYILVITCLSTRAVHLEPTGGMDTTDVINAISRFTYTRGTPLSITSDNQTSFVKSNQDLCDWLKTLQFEEIEKEYKSYKDQRSIKWYFNPPLAPHFGGVFEIIVKATKRALYATIGHADLKEDDFRTAVSKVTWMLNQRPIQKVGDASDFVTITPNHFLLIPEDATFPPDLPENELRNLQSRLRYQIQVQSHFWQRFQKELIPLLAPRSKWFQRQENLKEGDLVVEIDETTPRGTWKLARIEKVHTSSDAFVRSVDIVTTKGKVYTRPIHRLIPIRL